MRTPERSRIQGGRPALLLVLAVGGVVLSCLGAWFARAEGHWSVDSAVWELMAREVSRRGVDGLWVDNLAAAADPEGRFFPGFFFSRRGDRYHFAFQPAFGLLSALPYRWAGKFGLLALPLLAALAVGWLVGRGAEGVRRGWGWAAAALVLFATPIPLYAVTVWNHLPSVVLLTSGAYLVWRYGLEGFREQGTLAAGASVGLGLLFRNEAYVYFGAMLVSWLVAAPHHRWRGAVLLVAGFAAGWAVQAALNLSLFGSAFGVKAESVASRQASSALDLGYRLWNAYLFVAAPDFSAFLRGGVERGLVLFVPVVAAAAVLALPGVESRLRLASASLWAVAGAVTVVLAARTQVTGLFWVAPFSVLAFLHRPRTPVRVLLGTLCLLFAAGVVYTASHGGFQWGPRYLLALFPLGVWLVLDAWASAGERVRQALQAPAAVLVLLAFLAQAAGADHADQGQWRGTQALRSIRALPTQYVVVGLEIFAWDFAPAYGEKVLMSVDSPEELEEAVRALARARVQAFTYVPRSGLRFDRTVVERVEANGLRYRVSRDTSQGDLRWVEYRLVSPRRGDL